MTQNRWCNLFLTSDSGTLQPQTVIATLQQALTDAGYTAYDAFGRLPGRAYTQSVRLFAAPLHAGWMRIIAEEGLPPLVLGKLAADYTCVQVRLTNDDVQIDVYAKGAAVEDIAAALVPYLRAGKTEGDVRSALVEPQITVIDTEPEEFLDGNVLPEDVQQMATKIDKRDFDKMFERMSGKLFGRVAGNRDEAQALIQQAQSVDWNTPHGWKAQAFMDALSLPLDWREPTFSALSSAYGLHARRQRKPDAKLYPGDDKAMNAVPDALDYIPIFAGKDA